MNRDQALAFCELLYGDPRLADEGLCIAVTSITPGRRGKLGYTFCETTTHAADTAIKIAEDGNNAYCSMALFDKKAMKSKRGSADDAKAIVGFWADIDIADPLAPKPGKNPPANYWEACMITREIAQPSIIVHSGHGIHCYWLFKDPWIFADDDDRRHAADVVRAFEATLHQIAKEHGRTLDSVSDLARILRIPGTINSKVEVAVTDVEIRWPPPGRWHLANKFTRAHLESLIKAPAPGQAGEIVKPEKLGNVEFRLPTDVERAKIDAKIQIACLNEDTFKSTWDRKRSDFASTQHSASEYDMSIAHQTVAAGWSDQEVYWTILLWREKHGEDTDKILKRTDYMEMTIAKAKKGNVVAVAIKTIDEITFTVQQMESSPPPATEEQKQELDEKKQKLKDSAFENVSKLARVKLTNFTREGEGDDCVYYMTLKEREICMGPSKDLFTIDIVRTKMFDHVNHAISDLKRNEWIDAMHLLVKFVEERANPFLTGHNRWLSYLLGYIERAPVITGWADEDDDRGSGESKFQNVYRNRPFWLNGDGELHIYFHLESLRNYVAKYYGEKVTREQLGAAMRALNAEPKDKYVKYKGDRLHRYLWRISKQDLSRHQANLQNSISSVHSGNPQLPPP